nr:DNA polymerase [Actinomycetota bacterium]
LHHLALDTIATTAPPDLFGDAAGGDTDEPVGSDGHLRPEWTSRRWCATAQRLARWAELASTAAALQQSLLDGLDDRPAAPCTARSESAAELLCAEMSFDGLPMDRFVAEAVIARFVGPRPANDSDAAAGRAQRHANVLAHAPPGVTVDLASPAQVKSLLGSVGVDVADTRAGRLRPLRDTHPLIDALLKWRKAERVATTYGYRWLDDHLGVDGRLRGAWTATDAAAGRMTASAGLHNMPAEMREAVVADPGHVFVRADLGQIEPRVLAAISADKKLAHASVADDMYAQVATELDVDRATAKVAMLGAMYGQTTGHGAQALRRLQANYPEAMAYLDRAARGGAAGRDLRTHGGRLIATAPTNAGPLRASEARALAAAQGATPATPSYKAPPPNCSKCGPPQYEPAAPPWPPPSSCAYMTNSSSTRPSNTATPSPSSSATASKKPSTAGPPTTPSASSPTPPSSNAGQTPKHRRPTPNPTDQSHKRPTGGQFTARVAGGGDGYRPLPPPG